MGLPLEAYTTLTDVGDPSSWEVAEILSCIKWRNRSEPWLAFTALCFPGMKAM